MTEEENKCAVCGDDIEDTSTWYREDKNETVCEECYFDWLEKKAVME